MTPTEIKTSYRRILSEVGEPILIRRYTGSGANRPRFDAPVLARVVGYQPHELVGTLVQGDRKLIVLVEDLIDAQFALPVVTGDKAVIRGVECNIEAADDSTRRIGTTLIAYELQVRGG
ncbi:hypothetical protein [Mesorhizobium sp. B263B2A]|uniref:hypothetical protein n=1 Tax=Mesorhizobium sp. B263B2A TaxID=2876669 RepID=UPI001CD06676|nr:hypothetical protein [Mesorhizobium sp. B263B2A]MCA0032760.1 hypothetical protein [Mesorhizobium sp. B263B2A]